MCTIRAVGSTRRIAFTAAMSASQSFRRKSQRVCRHAPNGAAQPHSPAMQAKKVISLIGVKKFAPGVRGITYSAVAWA